MHFILNHPFWSSLVVAASLALCIFGKRLFDGFFDIINEENMRDRDREYFLDYEEDQRQKDVRRIGLKPLPRPPYK